MHRLAAAVAAALGAALVASPSGVDATVPRSSGLATRKSAALADDAPPILATLVQTHTGEHLALDERSPTPERFSALLCDRVTGERIELDARLLGLLRSLARRHPGARIELVSGYRSPKLNEMLRKKGHNVASSSQHSLGHAVDFRIVEPDAEKGVHPRVLEREIRQLGWQGGVGVYPTKPDWFVHADVGRLRRWDG
jgi:uncharacterized protein YcbK (DUF882 family)